MTQPRNAIWLFCLLLFGSFAIAGDWNQPLKLSHRVTDLTGTLSAPELSALESKLKEFEQTTSTQVVVVMVSTIGDTPIEDAALQVAETNGIGQKGKDNGALLFISKDDHLIRIEVGYGLEGTLTDALSGQIIRKEITPWFRQGNFYAGIDAGVNAIMAATKNEYKADEPRGQPLGGFPLLFIVFLFFFIMMAARRGRRSLLGVGAPFYYPGWGGIPRSGGGGWSGGSWGGGFSGGGGSFGGGGASGRW